MQVRCCTKSRKDEASARRICKLIFYGEKASAHAAAEAYASALARMEELAADFRPVDKTVKTIVARNNYRRGMIKGLCNAGIQVVAARKKALEGAQLEKRKEVALGKGKGKGKGKGRRCQRMGREWRTMRKALVRK